MSSLGNIISSFWYWQRHSLLLVLRYAILQKSTGKRLLPFSWLQSCGLVKVIGNLSGLASVTWLLISYDSRGCQDHHGLLGNISLKGKSTHKIIYKSEPLAFREAATRARGALCGRHGYTSAKQTLSSSTISSFTVVIQTQTVCRVRYKSSSHQ